MAAILLFLLISVISFAGSLQLGPVNLTVIQYTINYNRRSGFWVAVGGCLPEIIYGWLAVFGVSYINIDSPTFYYLKLAVIPVLLGIGLYNVFKRNAPVNKNLINKNAHGKAFTAGFLMGIGNPQLLPFWGIVLLNIEAATEMFDFTSVYQRSAVVAGAAFGAFLLLWLINYLTYRNKDNISFLHKYNLNRIIGFIFIILALAATYKFLK